MSLTHALEVINSTPTVPPFDRPLDPPDALLSRVSNGQTLVRIGEAEDASLFVALSKDMCEQVLLSSSFSANVNRPGFNVDGHIGGVVDAFANSIVRLDDPEHSRVRNLVTSAFRPKRILDLMPDIKTIVDESLSAVKAAGPGADWVRLFTSEVPSRVMAKILGLREEDRLVLKEIVLKAGEDASQFTVLANELDAIIASDRLDDGILLQLRQFHQDGQINARELTSMSVLFVFAGNATTADTLGLAIALILDRKEVIDEVRADPTRIDALVEEVLRITTVPRSGPRRLCIADTEICGYDFKQGDMVIVGIHAANRDPAHFTSPNEINLERPRTEKHVSFGGGIHLCLGQFLARLELKVALEGVIFGFNGAKLAVPLSELKFRSHDTSYCTGNLPVTWESTNF